MSGAEEHYLTTESQQSPNRTEQDRIAANGSNSDQICGSGLRDHRCNLFYSFGFHAGVI